MEVIETNERLRDLFDSGQGFVFNDFEGDHHTQSSGDFNKLHRAHCEQCNPRRETNAMTVRTSGQKLFFPTFSEAVGWLMEHRPGNYSKCAICNPS